MKTLSIRNVANASVFRQLLMSQQTGWNNKPGDWSDIRRDCPADSIALYAGHTADYSQYDNLGFTATCTGGYKVFIDGTQYGSTYASGAQCNITWSTSGITTGDDITTPSALKAHKIWIEPATSGNNITVFHLDRVAASGTEAQGLLWAHFNLTNQITPAFLAGRSGQYTNAIAKAITAKNNVLNVSSSMNSLAFNATALEYIPVIDGNNETVNCTSSFAGSGVLKITIKNFKMSATNSAYVFYNSKVQEIVFKNVDTSAVSNFTYFFGLTPNLKKLPDGMDYSSATTMPSFLHNNTSLQDTVLDVSSATDLTRLGVYGSSETYFVGGLKGLRVSNQAPFDYETPPQITVAYTGLDRAALVQLFNDLPTVSGGQIINITGAIGSEDLTEEEVAIADNKGWTITGGPQFANLYAYTDGNNNTIYSTDNLPTTSSELFNSTGTKLTGNPTAVTQGIINLSNYKDLITITDGVASGFEFPRTLDTTSVFNPSNKPWSWVFKIKTPSSISSRKLFVGARQHYYKAGFGAELTAEGKIFCGFTNGGPYEHSWKIGSITEPTVLDTSTWYYVKPYFTGTKYQLAIKKEGDSTWSEGGTAIESTTAINSNDAPLQIGADVASGSGWNYPFSGGSIDLKETYSEIDGVKTHYYTSTLTYNDVIYTRNYDKDILR